MEICGSNATYRITEEDALFVDYGDAHEIGFESMVFVHRLGRGDSSGSPTSQDESKALSGCIPTMYLFPTAELENQYASDHPITFTFLVAAMFGVSIFLFSMYDRQLTRRQSKVEKQAHRTDAIVSQLFPGRIRDMVMQPDSSNDDEDLGALRKQGKEAIAEALIPQADFFPETTIMVSTQPCHSYNEKVELNVSLFICPTVCRCCWFHGLELNEGTLTGLCLIGNNFLGIRRGRQEA